MQPKSTRPKAQPRAVPRNKNNVIEIADDSSGAPSPAAAAAAAATAAVVDRIKIEDTPDAEPSLHDVEMAPAEGIFIDDDSDDDDPVVRSYDVVVNSSVEEMLHLFQYPNRLRHRPYTAHHGTAPLASRWKAKSGLVELDVPVNTASNYDRDKGITWGKAIKAAKVRAITGGALTTYAGSNASGEGAGKKRRLGSANSPLGGSEQEADDDVSVHNNDVDWNTAKARGIVLDKQTLGAKIQPSKINYFVGVWEKDTLHFTRLRNFVQLRPQFHHIDKAQEQERATLKALKESITPSAKSQQAKAVDVIAKGPLEGKHGETRAVSGSEALFNDIRKEEDEQWKEVTWVDQDSHDAWDIFGKMHEGEKPETLNSTFTEDQYLDLCSIKEEKKVAETN